MRERGRPLLGRQCPRERTSYFSKVRHSRIHTETECIYTLHFILFSEQPFKGGQYHSAHFAQEDTSEEAGHLCSDTQLADDGFRSSEPKSSPLPTASRCLPLGRGRPSLEPVKHTIAELQ